ncbi:ribonuclease P protein subunit RPR2 [Methanomicrobium sp. W14]|uniref:ribonuclease P protein component 4 n=1 Tax=Methanomicrobium sp. W14 TaxID=2817839 RepID=UPI001AE1BB7C|nr:ribonuclease P [Methanomicrobium sp. W14]MBP2132856.1 ribonuclease P protein subunit RPR2 [Methanomicrobium sp. W14]
MAKKNDKSGQRILARERIVCLFESAFEFYEDNPLLSKKCILHARKISMRYRVKIPKPYNRRYCRKCFSCFIPGVNMTTRINRGKVVVTCKSCGNIRRYPVKEKKCR